MKTSQLLGRICSLGKEVARSYTTIATAQSAALLPLPVVRSISAEFGKPSGVSRVAAVANATSIRSLSGRSFSSQPVQPNPLGSTNTSGVGANPVGTSSAPVSEAVLPSPLSASTNVSPSSSTTSATAATTTATTPSSTATKPDPLAASTNVATPSPSSSTMPKPDPLAASTNVAPDTSKSASESSSYNQSTYDGPPKLIVFGGNGFVGTRVCEEALNTGLAVVSISRSAAPKTSAAWTSQVDWVSGDAFEPDQWRDQLQGAVGIVSCLGGFGSNEFMLKVCGEANVGVIREAAQAGVPRCAFISVHDYNLPGFVLSGYFQGKRNAEHAMAASFPDTGVCLRPSFIHGTRYISGSIGIPLSLIGSPLAKGLGFLPTKTLANIPLAGAAFVPPISVQAVAKAAVAAATDPSVPGGILDVWQMQEYENR